MWEDELGTLSSLIVELYKTKTLLLDPLYLIMQSSSVTSVNNRSCSHIVVFRIVGTYLVRGTLVPIPELCNLLSQMLSLTLPKALEVHTYYNLLG